MVNKVLGTSRRRVIEVLTSINTTFRFFLLLGTFIPLNLVAKGFFSRIILLLIILKV